MCIRDRAWLTEDIDAEVAELRARGIVFEEYDFPGLKTENGIATTDGFKGAWFLDSEMTADSRGAEVTAAPAAAVAEGLSPVCDAGALDLAGTATGPTIITPH